MSFISVLSSNKTPAVPLNSNFNLTFSEDSKNFPEGVYCLTQTAHGHFNLKGDFWNIMGCMELPTGIIPAPRVAYIPFKVPLPFIFGNLTVIFQIPNSARSGPNQFENPVPRQEFLDSIVFGTPFYNTKKADFSFSYFQMFSFRHDPNQSIKGSLLFSGNRFVEYCFLWKRHPEKRRN